MKSFLLLLSCVFFVSSFAAGQEFYAPESVVLAAVPAGYPIVKGLVRKVDLALQKVTIKHDEIPNLSMPAMTMNFSVSDPAFLSGLAKDDKIVFAAEEIGGELTAIWIEKR